MNLVRLKNASKAPIINSFIEPRKDSLVVAQQSIIQPDKVGEFDGDNPSIRIYVLGGALVASDKAAKEWATKLKPAEA